MHIRRPDGSICTVLADPKMQQVLYRSPKRARTTSDNNECNGAGH